jgi:sterol desaturase/sphingolipid hydroxylase (fatty acid hydroxylase superfamily)
MKRRSLVLVEQTAADLGSYSIYAVASLFLLQVHFSRASPQEGPTVSTIDQGAQQLLQASNDDVDHATTSEVPVAFFICSLAIIAFELLDFTTKRIGVWLGCKEIPVRGRHLDEFRPIDQIFVAFSKANTGPFTYLFFRYLWLSDSVLWDWRKMTVTNALLPIPLLYIAFDATYCLLHWILHWQSIYPYIHKHHHVQKAPSRGSVDAANVHPVEMFLGEYNHMLAVFMVTSLLTRVHVLAPIVFLLLGGVMAGVNHTRHDLTVQVPLPTLTGWTFVTIFDSKAHDVHHRIPQSNYGQYTMFWDILFGSYRYEFDPVVVYDTDSTLPVVLDRPYDPNDRVNPDAQLDPNTGRTKRAVKVD